MSVKTVLHHIREPWNWPQTDQAYYFCDDPDCEVVYFGLDNSVVETSALRTPVGIKQNSPDALLCYCFGVTLSEARRNPAAKAFVQQQTREGSCACEITNPSGRCCLKGFRGN